jgi:ubiquitin-protein ligase
MNPRLRRLQSDYDLVREVFSGHPHVTIEPLGARLPPERYRIEFRLRGLYLSGERPCYRDIHHVEIALPLRYPAEKPYVTPLAPIFHPNIRECFCIVDYWAAGTTLAEIVVKLGDMIQWRVYNPHSPLDAIAAEWAIEQEPTGIFPVGKVDLGVADFDIQVHAAHAASPTGVELELPGVGIEDGELVVLVHPGDWSSQVASSRVLAHRQTEEQ